MGLLERVVATLSAKANALLDRYDDPAEAIDYACQLLSEEIGKVQQAETRLASAQQRMALQPARLESCATELELQAKRVAREGSDDLAREALARRKVLLAGVDSLALERRQLSEEDEHFVGAGGLLEARIQFLAASKESLKAGYVATGDRSEIDRAISQIDADVAQIKLARQRAESRAEELRGQAGKIDALLASESLKDLHSSPESIRRELAEARGSEAVERELATIKQGLPG